MKADAWKGKRKIKDRWEEETLEVVHQIAADIPSYKVMNQHGWSWVLHWNQLLLVASEVGIPLCMGNCHTWDRCTSPTPCKTTSPGGDEKKTPQEKDGKAVIHVRVEDEAVYHSDAECFPLSRGTYPIVEEWHCTQGRSKLDSTASAWGCASLKEWRDEPHNTLAIPRDIYCNVTLKTSNW